MEQRHILEIAECIPGHACESCGWPNCELVVTRCDARPKSSCDMWACRRRPYERYGRTDMPNETSPCIEQHKRGRQHGCMRPLPRLREINPRISSKVFVQKRALAGCIGGAAAESSYPQSTKTSAPLCPASLERQSIARAGGRLSPHNQIHDHGCARVDSANRQALICRPALEASGVDSVKHVVLCDCAVATELAAFSTRKPPSDELQSRFRCIRRAFREAARGLQHASTSL